MNRSTMVFLAFFSVSLGARADAINTASQYSIFIFNSLTETGTETQGSAAVGGLANFASATIDGNLVDGGSVDYRGGSVNGNVTAAGTVTLTDGATVEGTVTRQAATLPVDFASVQSGLDEDSLYWSSLPANGTSTDRFGTIILEGTDPSLDIFNIDGSALSSANSIVLATGIPSSATTIINVSGTADTLRSARFTLNNVNPENIIFNFYQAGTLNVNNIGVQGSILAPLATVIFSGANITGNLFANDLEAGSADFAGTSSFAGDPPFPAPEPDTISMLVLGAVLIVCGLAFRSREPMILGNHILVRKEDPYARSTLFPMSLFDGRSDNGGVHIRS